MSTSTPLVIASCKGHVEVVSALLEHPDIRYQMKEKTEVVLRCANRFFCKELRERKKHKIFPEFKRQNKF
jgi:hypothetical protein